jgi:hypothetical protein
MLLHPKIMEVPRFGNASATECRIELHELLFGRRLCSLDTSS